MRILLTNDDGIGAEGIWHAHEALRHWHCDIVAPAEDQSGASHSSHWLKRPLAVTRTERHGVPVIAVSGTPSDAVKFQLLSARQRYDLVLSGINAGENSGVAHFYSGTVAAAREAVLRGVPGIAVSVWRGSEERYRDAAQFLRQWLPRWLEALTARSAPPLLLNVNFPDCPADRFRGIHVAHQSTAFHDDGFEPLADHDGDAHRLAPGDRHAAAIRPGSDDWAVRQGYVTLTPLRVDTTCHDSAAWLEALHPYGFDP